MWNPVASQRPIVTFAQSDAPVSVGLIFDCSRSMLAESPSRLERARAALLDLAEAVQRRGGHRVALVEFAGRARLACPLTHDYDHFRDTVRAIDPMAFDPELGPGPEEKSGFWGRRRGRVA